MRNQQKHLFQGFTLIELLVGMTLAIIGLLVITQVVSVANTQKNTTASGADAQTAGSIGTYLIERDLRMAGFALNSTPLISCRVKAYDSGTVPARNYAFNMVPVLITFGAGGAPDSLTITYGQTDTGIAGTKLTLANAGDGSDFKVDNRFGFHPGNMIVVAESGVDTDGDGVDDCSLAQVTSLPATSGQTDVIKHIVGNYTNAVGQSVPARYNKAGGLGIPYSTGAKVFNLGDSPITRTYSINVATSQLISQNLMAEASGLAVGENIIMLKAMYGKDTDGDGAVDTFDTVTPNTPALWSQVTAIRFVLVARSHTRDVEMVSPAALDLMPSLTLSNGVTIAATTMALTDEQRHYRYKVYQTLVPLRNLIWKIS